MDTNMMPLSKYVTKFIFSKYFTKSPKIEYGDLCGPWQAHVCCFLQFKVFPLMEAQNVHTSHTWNNFSFLSIKAT